MIGKVAAAGLVLILAVSGSPARAQGPVAVGEVSEVRPDAFGTPPGSSRRTLDARADVFARERIDTVEAAWVELRFRDATTLRVGANSTVSLDRFVYDPERKAGEMTLDLAQGVFRFVTGSMPKEGYRIRTPSAVVGVRGTDVILRVSATETRVAVLEGAVVLQPLVGGGAPVLVPAGSGGRADASGRTDVQSLPPSGAGSVASYDGDGSLGLGPSGTVGPPGGGFGLGTVPQLPQIAPTLFLPTPPPPPPRSGYP